MKSTTFLIIALFIICLDMFLGLRDNSRNVSDDGMKPDTTIFALIAGYDRTELCRFREDPHDPWDCGTGRGFVEPRAWNIISASWLERAVIFWRSVYEQVLLLFVGTIVGVYIFRKEGM